MAEQTENTLTAYLGPEFQQKLIWQLLVEPEFAEKTIPILAVEYFDDPNFKRLFLIMLEHIKEYGKVPNLQNQSIIQAINEFKTPGNQIEEESLFAVIERIKLWNERVLNQTLMNDGDVVQKATNTFIKQQEYRKFAEGVLIKCKNGEIKSKHSITEIEEKLQKIGLIGIEEDNGTDATEGLEKALRKEFRKTIPTGVAVIDSLTGGGLGKGEMGLILSPSGVGKTSLLTKIANTARENDYNVLQIVFEDTMEQIKRKHVTIWSKIPLSQLDENNELAFQKANDHINKLGPGKLTIKKFSQEDTTMKDIRNWITREQKRHNFKYDIIILDYLDCLESHKKSADRTEAELVIVKSFEAMASDFDVPCWSAIQGGRSSFGAELVEAHQTGGSIKRIQKAHFFMSIAKTADQQEASLASIRIIKARFCKDGQTFKDCIFNNDTLEIIIKDDRYVGGGAYANKKKYADDVMAEQIEKHARGGGYGMVHAIASTAMPESPEDSLLGDMRDKFMENNNIVEANTVTDTVVNTKINTVIDTNVDTVIDTKIIKEKDIDILTIDDIPIEGVDLNKQNVLNDINNYINEPLLEWSGETFTSATNEIEVKYEDVKPKFEEIKPEIIPKVEEAIPKIVYNPEKNNIIIENFDIGEVEKKMSIDPDAPTTSQKNLFDFIAKQRISEIVNKKE